MFVVRFITKFDDSLPHYQKSFAQVLQSAPGKLGSRAANRSVNPDLICPPYILWPRRVRAGSDPSSPDPRPIVTRSQPLLRNLRRRRLSSTRRRPTLYLSSGVAYPSSPEQHSSLSDPILVVRRCIPVIARFFFNSRTRRRALRTRRRELSIRRCELSIRRRALQTRHQAVRTHRHALHTRRHEVCDPCRSTKTQVNPSSALSRTKHHQSNPSNVPGILDSNLSKRTCVYTSKILNNLVQPDPSSITGSGLQSDSSLPVLLPRWFT